MQKGDCQIVKALTIKGMTFGIIAGLIVTLFDGLFMLVPNTYVPYSYPILLITFNTIFWVTIGGMSGLFMWVCARNRKDLTEKENSYWVFFFLLPFALIYGLLGRLFIPLFSTTVKTASPVFDHHLSFIWASLIILFLFIYKREVTTNKSHAVSFMPEIVTFIALFMFCSNTPKILLIILKYIYYLLFQYTIISSYKEHLTSFKRLPSFLYIIGVLLILGSYLLMFFKIKLSNKKQYRVVIILSLIASISLAALL